MTDAGDAWRAATRPVTGFVLDGEWYELKRRWRTPLTYLSDDGDEWCLPFLLSAVHDADADVLLDRVLDLQDDLDQPVIFTACTALVRRATGMPWWTAARLFWVLLGNFQRLDAELVRDGVDVTRLVDRKPWRALAITRQWWLGASKDEAEWRKNTEFLDRPPLSALQSDEAAQRAIQEQAMAAVAQFRG